VKRASISVSFQNIARLWNAAGIGVFFSFLIQRRYQRQFRKTVFSFRKMPTILDGENAF